MTMRNTIAAFAALVLGTAVHAADFYGEMHAGTTRATVDAPGFTGDERVEGAYGIGVGVKYNEYFATQLEWHTLGENTFTPPAPCPLPPCPITVNVVYPEHAWVLRALPRLPLGERFAMELGVGYAKWEGDIDGGGISFGFDGTDWLYSLGFEWRFAERWSATAEMQVYEIEGYDLDWTGATLRWRF
jgi:hypothetical protein